MNYEGEKFLLKLYRELYSQDNIKHSGSISDNKYELINKYLKRLEKTERVFLSEKEELIKYLKNRYYDKYVIKKEDIISKRSDTKEKIISSQKESLDIWLDYLMKETTYPMWARYWAFQGMLKLGRFDKDTKKFSNRSKKTTSPFIELNKDALKSAIELIIKTTKGKKPDDKDLEVLSENGSFSKIYAYFISKEIENQKESNIEDGIWKVFHYGQGRDLVKSLNEKCTGWCITSETIANNYLEYGSIYIYYTKDNKGNYTIPRICIRKEDINVVEVKGTLDYKCNLEYSMVDIAINKLKEINHSDNLQKIVNDIKKTTEIVDKYNNSIPLSINDLRFIYEIDSRIENFTWGKDQRIKEMLNKRNPKKDLSLIFNCSPEEIGTDQKDLNNNRIKVYYGNIEYNGNNNIIIPTRVIGDITINCEKVKGFEKLKSVSGSIISQKLESAEGINNIMLITDNLELANLKVAKGFENLEIVGGTVFLPSIVSLKGFNSLKTTGNLCIKNAKTAEGLERLERINGNLDISSMIDLSDFKNLKVVEKKVICYAADSIDSLPNTKIKGDVHFYHIFNIHSIIKKVRKL